MPRDYNDFGEQTSFIQGENRSMRMVAEGQVNEAVNMDVRVDRLAKLTGYAEYANLNVTNSYVVILEGNKAVNPGDYWAATYDGDSENLYRVNASGVANTYAITSGNSSQWAILPIGKDSATPDAVLASTGSTANIANVTAKIFDLANTVTGPVAWNTANTPAVTSMVVWGGRLWGVSSTDSNIYYTEVRNSWSADVDDWQYVTVSATEPTGLSVDNQFLVVLNQNLYVFKDRGIYRIEYVGGGDLYRQVEVTKEYGCIWHHGWTKRGQPKRERVVFYDQGQFLEFDGNGVRQLSNEANIRTPLLAISPTDVSMSWDSEDDTVRVLFFFTGADTYGWDIRFKYAGDNPPAFAKLTMNDKIRSQAWMEKTGDRTWFAGGLKMWTGASVYTQDGVGYESYVTPGTLNLGANLTEKYPVLRMVHLDLSAAGEVVLGLRHRNGEDDFGEVRQIPLDDKEHQPIVKGINRPGYHPQVKITDLASTVGWSLYGIAYKGYRKGRRTA